MLLVAHCTTSLQPKPDANAKKHCFAQCVGCGCAKGFFRTTTIEKAENKPSIKEETSHWQSDFTCLRQLFYNQSRI
jgi:hypothetical protein